MGLTLTLLSLIMNKLQIEAIQVLNEVLKNENNHQETLEMSSEILKHLVQSEYNDIKSLYP